VEDDAGEVTFATDRRPIVARAVTAISEEGSPWRSTMFTFFETYSNVYMPKLKSRILMRNAANTNVATAADDATRRHLRSRALRRSCRPGGLGDPL
jgi:hypothetical protein